VEGAVLITGGDGYVGSRLARELRARGGGPVCLWLHASDQAALREKQARLRVGPAADGRVSLAWGELSEPEPLRGVDPAGVRRIVHAAAVTRFNVERELAERVNVEGSRKVFEFARRCPHLESLDLVSTIYSAGLAPGALEERAFDGAAGFSNHYEWSKHEAESILAGEHGDLPWRVLRVATVICDDDSGAVTQHNAFHNTLKLLHYGLLSLLPGDPQITPYFVTGDFVARAAAELLQSAPLRGYYHLCHEREHSLSLGGLVDVAFEVFESDPSFKARRVLRPLFCDARAFELLVEGIGGFGGSVVDQAIASVAPFARQLYVDKRVRNERLRAALGGYEPPDTAALLRRTCESLLRARWGRAEEVASR
jgi:nucleoside-diphosphate-sugar epimerase